MPPLKQKANLGSQDIQAFEWEQREDRGPVPFTCWAMSPRGQQTCEYGELHVMSLKESHGQQEQTREFPQKPDCLKIHA